MSVWKDRQAFSGSLSGVSWLRVFSDGKSGGFPLSMIIRSTVQASGVVAMYRGGSFSMLL